LHRRPQPLRQAARLTAGLAVLAATASLTSCGGGDSDDARGEPASGVVAPGEETSAAEPDVVPADGPLISGKPFAVNMPRGWRLAPRASTFLRTSFAPGDSLREITVSHLPVVGGESIDSLARGFVRDHDPRLQRTDDTEISGIPAAHLVGQDRYEHADLYAVVARGETIDITFSFAPGTPPARRDQLVSSVLASWQWH
jgi:hypothetical protein